VLLFFFEEYNESGYFTVCQRVGDAFMIIGYYTLFGIVGGLIFLGILVGGERPCLCHRSSRILEKQAETRGVSALFPLTADPREYVSN
jgi:hypothetical protein